MSDMNQVLMNLLLGQGGQSSVEELLNENGDLDPMTRMLVSQAFSNNESEENEDELDPEDNDRQSRRRTVDRLRARFERMQRTIEEMQWQLEELETQNDQLAAALGACYLCWGQDADCPECRGRGKPGSILPERSMFRKWILPAVRTAQTAAQQRLKRKANSTQSKTEEPKNAG
ncbi:hypothetical protein ACQ4M3_36370 [Leptolyngbya sp. AN03gr2]|uniref:hypothetical protein n=1 Tax=unclassified Leptolyngbya TaxID=2650499 RepID=UPI003D323A40